MRLNYQFCGLLVLASFLPYCSSEETTTSPSTSRRAVISNYAALVYSNYSDALALTEEMQQAIELFLEEPSAARLEWAKRTWLAARVPYGQTEAFRFYNGPIDDDNGYEERINAWPLDEAYIDYVEGHPDSGIINDESIDITEEELKNLNAAEDSSVVGADESDGTRNVATGFHAIEFLLWGQDHEDNYGPGARDYTDYTTATNADRRSLYLSTVTALLVADLTAVTTQWAPNDATNYRGQWVNGDVDTALRSMLSGMGILAKGELGSSRMDNALSTHEQEDEHSCFSDNTTVDIQMNTLSIENVYYGRYGSVAGASLSDLVASTDGELSAEMDAALSASKSAMQAIPAPFDMQIKEGNSEGHALIDTAIDAIYDEADLLVKVAQTLNLGTITTDLE